MNPSQIVFTIYIGIALYIGWKTKTSQARDFWTASGQLDGFSLGLSISAGFMSVSWSCVYATQLFYWYGLGAIWLITIPWIITLLTIFMLSQKFHMMKGFSQPELVSLRFGSRGKILTSLALIFVFLVWGGAELFIAAKLLTEPLKVSVPFLIVIIGLVILLYSVSGGFRAVILTDKLQYLLVALYIVTIGFLSWKGATSEQIDLMPNLKTPKSGTSFFTLFSPGIPLIVLTLIAYLPGWIFESDIWLRIQAARNTKEAYKGLGISLINAFIFVGILPLGIAYFAFLLYPPLNGHFPPLLGFEADGIFSRIATDFAPSLLIPLITLGLIAASMSTIDTCSNVVALSVGYDLAPLIPNSRIRKLVNNPKTVTGVVVFFTILFALNTESLWDLFYLSSGILTTTVAPLMIGLLVKHSPRRPYLMASLTGFLSTFIFYYLEKFEVIHAIEPEWIRSTGVGYILYALILESIIFFATYVFPKLLKNK